MESADYKLFLARIEDLATSAQKYQRAVTTPFLDPAMIKRAEILIKKYGELAYQVIGGYDEAERNVILLYPSWMNIDGKAQAPISALCIRWDERYYSIGHRDILGSILGLGIKRERIGDIIVENHHAYVIAYKDISDYIIQNLIKAGKAPVNIDEIAIQDLKVTVKKGKIIKTTVSSLRLDCIASSGFGMSRNKIVPYIRSEMIQVNWEPVAKPDYILKEGDMVSLRKRGRIKLLEVAGLSKKNRYHIILERWC